MSKFHSSLSYAVLAAAITSASTAFSLGLGDASISSTLGQPLEARIPITQLAGLSDNQLVVKVDAVWDDVTGTAMGGVDPRQLLLETAIDSNDTGVLRLRTRQPLTEPYLSFVVTVRWPDGVISREYTLLLDLPGSGAPSSTAAFEGGNRNFSTEVTSRVEAQSPPSNLAPESALANSRAPSVSSNTSPQSSDTRAQNGRYITRRGDSLWSIAAERRSSLGGTIKQRMAKIYASNPQAFVGGDPALLKEQVALDLSAETLRSASSELPEPETEVASSARVSQPAPEPQTPRGGPDGAGENKLNAIRREISQVTEAMAEMSGKLEDLQRQLQVLSEQQGSAAADDRVDVNPSLEADGVDLVPKADPAPGQPSGDSQPSSDEQAGTSAVQGEQNTDTPSDGEPGENEQIAAVSQRPDTRSLSLADVAAPTSADSPTTANSDDGVSLDREETVALPAQANSTASNYAWLRWLALPVLVIVALLWWRQRRGDSGPVPAALAEQRSEGEAEWMVSAPRARPRAPASEEFGDLFSELAQENRRDLPGTTPQNVRSAIDAQHTVAQTPAVPKTQSETPELPRRSAFAPDDFADTSTAAGEESVFADLESGLSDLEFDDIDLNEQSADMPLVDDAKSVGERAAACMALVDYNGAREILEAALQHSNDAGLQLQLLDVYAAQAEAAEFEALALQMEFAGADDNTLAEIQLIRDKLNGAVDNGDYNGHSA